MPHNDPTVSPDIDPETIAPVAKGAMRKCILSGSRGERGALIRLALDADGNVAPDLGARSPGRGAWVSPDRQLIETALAKGKLRGMLMRAFKTSAVQLPDNLADQIADGLARRALDRLGLENKAGNLVWGADRIGDALAVGRVRLLLHAGDAAPDGISKLESKRRGSPREVLSMVLPVPRAQLSMALGRENVVHAAVCDAAACARVAAAVERWRAFSGFVSEEGLSEDAAAHRGT
jgi:predicted RNA-binding protein YlxR (DUF448 family)